MKKLIFFISLVACGQGYVFNPFTNNLDKIGGSGSGAWSAPANAQTGTTYTFVAGDCGKTVTFSNASAVAVTLPQAGASFPDGCVLSVKNIGNGDVTITPTTSTISGTTSITMSLGEWVLITSNGTNYEGQAVRNTAGTGITQVKSRTGISTAVDTAYLNANYPLLVGGLVPAASLGSGTPSASNFLRGDQTWAAVSGGGILFASNAAADGVAAGATSYYGAGVADGSVAIKSWGSPVDCTITRSYFRTNSAQPGTGSMVVTVYVEGAATAITWTIAAGGAATLLSDTTNTASVAAGNRVSFQVVNNASGTSAQVLDFSLYCAI